MGGRDPDSEIRELRGRIAMLVDEAAANERLLRRSQERELELLKAENIAQLFEAICRGLKTSYGLESVTLLLWDPQHEIRHLLIADHMNAGDFPQVIFTDSVVGLAPQFVSFHKPWLGPYMGCDHQLLFPDATSVKSVALIPLRRQDRVQGSLNFGSADEKRFSRHLATDFLAHLGVIASFAIENTVNRARLVRSGLTDFLTGWHNRRYLNARLKEELARAQRQGTGLTCLLIDLDRFKQINDQHGHLAGDMALRETAQRVDAQIRGSDAAARFGGDEFVVLAPGATPEQAAALAERIRLAVCDTPLEITAGVKLNMTVSIGVAGIALKREDSDLKEAAERLLAEADSALYRAKQLGRNRVELA
ncbi:MAG: sensor domain-containing diguanylate cyclase [Lysobacterales bacterium]|jgi:two-component system, cell cycle response regulator|nr:MAG: sensor domain-containing diguanylate cyclase [Xanthomonadales bacterium]